MQGGLKYNFPLFLREVGFGDKGDFTAVLYYLVSDFWN